MNPGGIPVVQSGQLGMFDRSLSPVPSGHVLVLSGSGGAIELAAGTRTDFDLRRRYPSFALVSLKPSEVEFSQGYVTSDASYGYKIVMHASVQVARAADFIRIYGIETHIGTPLIDHWKVRIGELVNRHGRDGLDELQRFVAKMLSSMRDAISDKAPTYGGIRLLGCTFEVTESPQSVVHRELQTYGSEAAPGLKIRFPEMAGEIDRWIDGGKAQTTAKREERRAELQAKVEETELLWNAQLNIADRMIRMGIVDPDEVPGMLDPGMKGSDGKFKLLDSTAKSEPKRIAGGKPDAGQSDSDANEGDQDGDEDEAVDKSGK